MFPVCRCLLTLRRLPHFPVLFPSFFLSCSFLALLLGSLGVLPTSFPSTAAGGPYLYTPPAVSFTFWSHILRGTLVNIPGMPPCVRERCPCTLLWAAPTYHACGVVTQSHICLQLSGYFTRALHYFPLEPRYLLDTHLATYHAPLLADAAFLSSPAERWRVSSQADSSISYVLSPVHPLQSSIAIHPLAHRAQLPSYIFRSSTNPHSVVDPLRPALCPCLSPPCCPKDCITPVRFRHDIRHARIFGWVFTVTRSRPLSHFDGLNKPFWPSPLQWAPGR